MAKPPLFMCTVNFSGVRIFRIFTVVFRCTIFCFQFYPRSDEIFEVLKYPELSYHPTVLGQFTENIQHKVSIGKFSLFLAHQSRTYRIGRPLWSVVCVSVRPSSSLFKHLLLRNHQADWSQISNGVSMGWGNESMFIWSWSHDQDGHHAYIL